MRPIRVALFYARGERNETLSYQHGWPGEFLRDARFAVRGFNLLDRRDLLRLRVGRRALEQVEALVLLHSVFSNENAMTAAIAERVAAASAPSVLFVGNEYKLMPEKVAFAEEVGTALLVSQLSSPDAHALYEARLGCKVIALPNTGFDPDLFAPRTPLAERPIGVGYRAFASPWYLGHAEREQLAERVPSAAAALGLSADISLSAADRFDESGWAAFLNSCRAQVGSEAGGDFFELTDEMRYRVNAYLQEHPEASFAEVRERFFVGRRGVSGRALSGRIVEAAATKTVQVLLEGEYGGYFQPDVHYIPLRKDFSNLDEALRRLGDLDECRRLGDAAYEVARRELTYERLLTRFHEALAEVVR